MSFMSDREKLNLALKMKTKGEVQFLEDAALSTLDEQCPL